MSYQPSDRYLPKYRGKTLEISRPTGNEREFRTMPDREIDLHLEAWDRARSEHDTQVAFYAGHAAKVASEEAENRRIEAERKAVARASADEKILTPALRAFKATGGTEEEFEAVKPQILADARVKAALDAATAASDDMQPKPSRAYRF